MLVLIAVHLLLSAALAVYGLHMGVLYWLSRRQHDRSEPPPDTWLPRDRWPRVTVQLPMYNEPGVAQRIIRAVAALDYPRDLLDIQVLDDSTDRTTDLARAAVDEARAAGLDIALLHRDHRAGFKAGALAEGLATARGELIAVFDADFVPRPEFLHQIVVRHRAFADPRVGYAQARWTFHNRDANALTRALALVNDIHFFAEKPGRYRHGFLDNFNGSGGLWRRTCIEDAGGWQSDTLTEDLDLSYRAELKGWRGCYLFGVEAPNDLPDTLYAFKRQQQRWGRGTAQCLRKLTGGILGSHLTWRQKLMGLLHISGYLVQPLGLFGMLVWPPLLVGLEMPWPPTSLSPDTVWVLVPFHIFLTPMWVAPMVVMYLVQRQQGRTLRQFLRDLPLTFLVGMGLLFSSSVAVLVGLFSRQAGVFERTPKDRSRQTRSEFHAHWTVWAEVLLLVYSFGSFAGLLWLRYGPWATCMAIYGAGFLAVLVMQWRELSAGRTATTTATVATAPPIPDTPSTSPVLPASDSGPPAG